MPLHLETSTHNLHFHDNASIFSICCDGTHLLTAGGDGSVRVWRVSAHARAPQHCYDYFHSEIATPPPAHTSAPLPDLFSPNTKHCAHVRPGLTHTHTTSTTSSLSLCYTGTHTSASAINCIRFSHDKRHMAYCTDSNQLVVNRTRLQTPEKLLELAWVGHYLIAASEKGTVSIFSVTSDTKLVQTLKLHKHEIVGLMSTETHKIFCTVSRDGSCKLLRLQHPPTPPFTPHSTLQNIIQDKKFTLFKRGTFSNHLLLIPSTLTHNKHSVTIYHYPFHPNNTLGTIQGFDSTVTRILEHKNQFYFFTKSSIYITSGGVSGVSMSGGKTDDTSASASAKTDDTSAKTASAGKTDDMCTTLFNNLIRIEGYTFRNITDATVLDTHDNDTIIFTSATDGFVYSLRIINKE